MKIVTFDFVYLCLFHHLYHYSHPIIYLCADLPRLGESREFLNSYPKATPKIKHPPTAPTASPITLLSFQKHSLCNTHKTALPTFNKPIIAPTKHPSPPLPSDMDREAIDILKTDPHIPDEVPNIRETAGKFGLMFPRTYALAHSASNMLQNWAQNGCPVDVGPSWTYEHIMAAIKRGNHRTTQQEGAATFLQKETKDKVAQGYARTVKWKDIKNNLHPNFKISPVAMVPHKSKAFRVILDLSFRLRQLCGKYWESVNSATNRKAPKEAMAQLGHCIRRIISVMADNFDPQVPFMFAKFDVKDGFWRMAVNDDDAWHFCYILPTEKPLEDIDETEFVVPNSLQMGWAESPPYFCAASETARDVTEKLAHRPSLPPHELEDITLAKVIQDDDELSIASNNSDMSISSDESDMSISSDESDMSISSDESESTLPHPPLHESIDLFEVYVDDFIGVTNNTPISHLRHLSRAILHGIHSIFPPPSVTGHPSGNSVSIKKVYKGEGQWQYVQEILGWLFDGKEYTISLPPDKLQKILDIINECLKLAQIPLNKFQKMAGKLQHASIAMPGGWGLFSPLYMALRGDPDFINMTPYLRQALTDWKTIIRQIDKIPTHVLQLVPGIPDFLGFCDACKRGCGGVWFGLSQDIGFIVWRIEFPQDFQDGLITADNPNGWITMNDFELIGYIFEWLILEYVVPCLIFKHIGINCDNSSTVSWTQKYTSTKSLVAARLLRVLSLRMHRRRTSPLTSYHVEGDLNTMADVASRSFRDDSMFAKSKLSLSDYFNSKFPLPQSASWKELTLPPELVSRVISCARSSTFNLGQLLRLPGIDKNTGPTGAHSYRNAIKTTPSYKLRPNLNSPSLSLPLLNGSGQATTAKELRLKLTESPMLWRPSARPSNWQDNVVRSTVPKGNTSNP